MAIRYTTYSYNFPFSEKYEKWLVTYNNANTFFYSGDGFQKIKADIKPDLNELLSFLSQNNIISGIQYERDFLGRINGIKYSRQDSSIIEAVINFCENNLHYSITKKGHDFVENLYGGSKGAADIAIKKIKKEIVLNYPNPARELIKYLKDRNLISKNVNPVCDTLSKDI